MKRVRFANLLPPPVPPEEVGSGKSEVGSKGRGKKFFPSFHLPPFAFRLPEGGSYIRLTVSCCVLRTTEHATRNTLFTTKC
jgi:hypothetical protein